MAFDELSSGMSVKKKNALYNNSAFTLRLQKVVQAATLYFTVCTVMINQKIIFQR